MILTRAYVRDHPGDPRARVLWAMSLKDQVLRSLASDYRLGDDDPAAYDAWIELKRRQRLQPTSLRMRCDDHAAAVGRYPASCPACRELTRLMSSALPTAPESPVDESLDRSRMIAS